MIAVMFDSSSSGHYDAAMAALLSIGEVAADRPAHLPDSLES
jgi:hypothetical protein